MVYIAAVEGAAADAAVVAAVVAAALGAVVAPPPPPAAPAPTIPTRAAPVGSRVAFVARLTSRRGGTDRHGAGLAGTEVVVDAGRRRGAAQGDAQLHARQQGIERADAARGLDPDVGRRVRPHQPQVVM